MDGGKADQFTLLGALVASIGWFVPVSLVKTSIAVIG